MAKKNGAGDGPKRKNPAELRREDYSPDDLRKFAGMLETMRGELIAYANRIEKEIGKRPIEIDGATKIRRGVDLISIFIANIEEGISKEKKKRSRFFDTP